MKLTTAFDLQPIVDALEGQTEAIPVEVEDLRNLIVRLDTAETQLKTACKDIKDMGAHMDHFKNKWLDLVEKKKWTSQSKSPASSGSSPSSEAS